MRRALIVLSTFLIGLFSLVASHAPFPHIGVTPIVVQNGKILVDKQTKHLLNTRLHFGESPVSCASRSISKHLGLKAKRLKQLSWSSDVYDPLDKHYITLFVLIDDFEAEKNLDSFEWIDPNALPTPVYAQIQDIFLDQINSIS